MPKPSKKGPSKKPAAPAIHPLVAMLIDLGKSPKKVEEYRRDPERYVDRLGLGAADRQAVLSGDPERLRAALVRAGLRSIPVPAISHVTIGGMFFLASKTKATAARTRAKKKRG